MDQATAPGMKAAIKRLYVAIEAYVKSSDRDCLNSEIIGVLKDYGASVVRLTRQHDRLDYLDGDDG